MKQVAHLVIFELDMVNPLTIIFGRQPTEMIERFPEKHETKQLTMA